MRKSVFRNPQRNDIVIYDHNGADILQRMVFYDHSPSILHTRQELLYFSPGILWHMLRNIFCLGETRIEGIRTSLQHPYRLYLLACVAYMNPKVVITFIDNCFTFQTISRIYGKARFYAIQNGLRLDGDADVDWVISMPNYFCWGQWDIDLYRKYGHQIDNYLPVGSLIASYYRSQNTEKPGLIFDICLVSQWRLSIMLENEAPYLKDAFVTLDSFLSRYISETSVHACIATCSQAAGDLENEINYYRAIYPETVKIITQDRRNFSTYRAMDRSDIIVSSFSSAAYEAFGWRKKVLFCNYSGHVEFDSPQPGIWSLNTGNYQDFSDRMNQLLSIDDDKYAQMTSEYAKYLMNYDRDIPTQEYIRNMVLTAIN